MAMVKVLPRPGRMVGGEPLEEVFDRHYADVYRYLARRVPVAVAEDLASETFVQVAAKGDTFDPRRGVLRGWIFGSRRISCPATTATRSAPTGRTPEPGSTHSRTPVTRPSARSHASTPGRDARLWSARSLTCRGGCRTGHGQSSSSNRRGGRPRHSSPCALLLLGHLLLLEGSGAEIDQIFGFMRRTVGERSGRSSLRGSSVDGLASMARGRGARL